MRLLRVRSLLSGLAVALPALCVLGEAAASAEGPGDSLIVAVREVPPFAMRGTSGRWEGLSVDLWQAVADQTGLEFSWKEIPLDATLADLETGAVDVGVAALTITAERERRIDFSHAYHVSGLALAVPAPASAWSSTLTGFFTLEFLSAVGTLALVLLVAGFAVWLFERKRNQEQFGHGSTLRGIGDGFWWSAVTMTTVGYGDKAPTTLGGRLVALVWMFASLIVIAGFTASIAASLTADRLESGALLGRPIGELVVGVLEGSAAEAYATDAGATVRSFPSVEAALEDLVSRNVEVVLHDSPVLKYHVRNDFTSLQVAPDTLVRDDYGFGLAPGSPLREDVNAALLSTLHEPVWRRIQGRYLGETGAD